MNFGFVFIEFLHFSCKKVCKTRHRFELLLTARNKLF